MSYTDPSTYEQAPVAEIEKPATRPQPPNFNYPLGFGVMLLLWGACLFTYALLGDTIFRLAIGWIIIINLGFALMLLGIMSLGVGVAQK